MKGQGRVFLIIWASVMTLLVIVMAGFEAMRIFGKSNLSSKSATSTPMLVQGEMPVSEGQNTGVVWQSDWVRYEGSVYDYNENITTFLIMGIDKSDEVVQEVNDGENAGQADALFLLVINPTDQSIKVIGINRNSMTDVDIYDEYGRYQTTEVAQIAIQHAYGNGLEKSCEYTVKAVSNMFYQLPIHGYAAINMSAIPTINDRVGGVYVVVLEDMTKFDKALKEGETVHLEGKLAYNYLKSRDVSIYGSNDSRLERQRQYLGGFIEAARRACEDNPNAAVNLFTAISDMMVTDITADEISYLAPMLTGYNFDVEDIQTLEGTTRKNGQFEEFIVDEDALYATILNTFYTKIDDVD